jgi:hypothetical protein
MEPDMGKKRKAPARAAASAPALSTKAPPVKALMEDMTVSVEDAGLLLGLSRGGAYVAVGKGEIPSFRIGHRIRVPTAALRAMLKLEASAA